MDFSCRSENKLKREGGKKEKGKVIDGRVGRKERN